MPRKCNNVNKDKILLMKTIKSRLIKIGMKVENYIYEQKKISSIQAQTFLEEISSYEPQCDGDVQCLQVIEKLTRYMNIVISNENNINNNYLELETMHNEGTEITNISLPICEVANNVDENEYQNNEKNPCNIPNVNMKYNITNQDNIQVEEIITTTDTKININKESELNSISITKTKTDKMLEINSIAPLNLREPFNNNTITYSNGEISLNKNDATGTTKPFLKESDKTESTNVTKVSHKLIKVKLNKEINVQDKAINNYKTNKKCITKYVNPKSNIIIIQEQTKTMQGCNNIKVIRPSYSPIIIKPQKTAETSKNIVTIIAKEKPKNTLHENKVTHNDIYNEYCKQNEITKNSIVNVDNVKKNVIEKPKNKPKSKKETNNNEKLVNNEEGKDKKVKRRNKNKINQTTNAKKSKTKKIKNSNMKLDLSWFDNIKFIRDVDEKEYYTIKD